MWRSKKGSLYYMFFFYLVALEMFYSNGTDLLLLSLHPTALLILWSPLTGDQLWKKSFTEALVSFTRDPFNSSCLVRKLKM